MINCVKCPDFMLLLLFLTAPVSSYDSCRVGGYLCGDLCLPGSNDLCICGNTILRVNSKEYCCSDEPCTLGELQIYDFAIQRNGTCITGKPTLFTKTCHGQCNYHPDHEDRNEYTFSGSGYYSRSHYPCKSGDQCVPEDGLCSGAALCQDKSDLLICEDLECVYPLASCSLNQTLQNNCYNPNTLTDGMYDCLNRFDETDTFIKKTEQTVDYNSLTPCNSTDRPGLLGLNCSHSNDQGASWRKSIVYFISL